jgi:hypothetical protein
LIFHSTAWTDLNSWFKAERGFRRNQQLQPKRRFAKFQRYWRNLVVSQVARDLDCAPPGMIRERLHRANKRELVFFHMIMEGGFQG